MDRFLDAVVICEKNFESDSEHKAWLKYRRSGVCGSDIPKLMGISKYGSPLSVYKEKKGELKVFANDRMVFALRIAPALCKLVIEDMLFLHDIELKIEEFPYMLCHKDNIRFVGNPSFIGSFSEEYVGQGYINEVESIEAEELFGVEVKVTNRSIKENEEELLREYSAKCQWYMGITGFKHFLLIVQSQNELSYRIIERDEEFIESIKSMASEFLERNIDLDIEPSPSGIEIDKEIVNKGVRVVEGKHKSLPRGILRKIKELELNISIMSLKKERLKQEVCNFLGDAKTGDDGVFKVTRYYLTSKPVNTKKLRADFPEVYKMVLKDKKSFLNMRIGKL